MHGGDPKGCLAACLFGGVLLGACQAATPAKSEVDEAPTASSTLAVEASASSTATATASAPSTVEATAGASAAASASADEDIGPEKLVLDLGPYPRKLEDKEKEIINGIAQMMNKQPRFTLLTQSITKQNADGWLRLLRAQMVGGGFDERRLTTKACVGPSKVVLSAIVRGDKECDAVDAFQKNKK